MDDNQISLGVEPEEISDSFICCVCLDLLYKPIVLSCGHVSCFWCVHRSMSSHRQSQCPLCRHQYIHFPTVCQMLHFLLLKKYPVAYKRRELQILEEEKQNSCFSPQLDAHGCSSQASQDLYILADSSCGESCANVKQVETISPIQNNGTAAPKGTHGVDYEGIGNVTDEEKNSLLNTDGGSGDQISVADVICAACKQLLFHPVVFNCGHVYCESCIVKPDEQMLRCKVCQSSHPSGFPKVCLELGHFLEEQFPKEYALRRDAVQLKQADSKHGNPTACETKADAQGQKLSMSSWSDPSSEVHIGVGCDSCGMYPIVGDRYNCLDCFEEIGFDLCSYCYNTNSKLPGRFNQQHTPEHKFKLVRRGPGPIRNQLELVTGHLDASSLALISAIITSEGTISPGAQEDAENRSATHAPSTSSGDEQDESLTSD